MQKEVWLYISMCIFFFLLFQHQNFKSHRFLLEWLDFSFEILMSSSKPHLYTAWMAPKAQHTWVSLTVYGSWSSVWCDWSSDPALCSVKGLILQPSSAAIQPDNLQRHTSRVEMRLSVTLALGFTDKTYAPRLGKDVTKTGHKKVQIIYRIYEQNIIIKK